MKQKSNAKTETHFDFNLATADKVSLCLICNWLNELFGCVTGKLIDWLLVIQEINEICIKSIFTAKSEELLK